MVAQGPVKPVQACRSGGLWQHDGVAQGKAKRPIDMMLSLAVILIPIVLISWFFTRTPDSPPVRPVDWAPTLATARAESPFPVLAPANLPGTWTGRKVVWAKPGQPGIDGQPSPGHAWQLGLLSPEQVYVTVSQRDAGLPGLIALVSRDRRKDGTAQVSGATWDRYVTDDGRTRALAKTDGTVVTVVAGDTSYDGLAAFASTLRSN